MLNAWRIGERKQEHGIKNHFIVGSCLYSLVETCGLEISDHPSLREKKRELVAF